MGQFFVFLTGMTLILSVANANGNRRYDSRTKTLTISNEHGCQVIGDSPDHLGCHTYGNGDTIHVRPVNPHAAYEKKSNIYISDGIDSRLEILNPIAPPHPEYSVAFPIEIKDTGVNFLRRKKRKSIIYRINYTSKDGREGFYIATVRTNNLLRRKAATCTMNMYDSQTFPGQDDAQKEEAMRTMARQVVSQKNFMTRECMPHEPLPLEDEFPSQSFGDFSTLPGGDPEEDSVY